MKLLVSTHSQEHEGGDLVIETLRDRGHRVARLDTDLFPTRVRLVTRYGPGGERFTLVPETGPAVDLDDVEATWHRRYYVGRDLPKDLDPQLRRPSVEESRRTLQGLVHCLDGFHFDRLEAGGLARSKPWQLKVARQLGFDLPRTLLTNDAGAVRAFAAEVRAETGHDLVTKMMTSFAVEDEEGRESVVYTNRLGEDDLRDLDGLDLCPMTFQERIPKKLELRVTVIGHRVFAAAVDSQALETAREDWRRDGVGLLDAWEPYDLPADRKEKIVALCDRLGLNYGALDLILTPDDRHVFLEINPVGEFYWLEKACGFPLIESLADLLVDPSTRRIP